VTYPGFTPVGNATLVVANVLTCNKHSPVNTVGLDLQTALVPVPDTRKRHRLQPVNTAQAVKAAGMTDHRCLYPSLTCCMRLPTLLLPSCCRLLRMPPSELLMSPSDGGTRLLRPAARARASSSST
jgi:hypothetical protein